MGYVSPEDARVSEEPHPADRHTFALTINLIKSDTQEKDIDEDQYESDSTSLSLDVLVTFILDNLVFSDFYPGQIHHDEIREITCCEEDSHTYES